MDVRNISSLQPRSFGSLFGFLLGSLLQNVVSAKVLPLQISIDANPWLAYNKPLVTPSHIQNLENWHPITENYVENDHSLTTTVPENHDIFMHLQPPTKPDYFQDYYPNRHYEPNYETFDPIGAESNIYKRRQQYRKTTSKPRRSNPKKRRTTTPFPEYYDSYEEDISKPYLDDSYENDYESIEETTKYYKNKKPTNNKKRKSSTTLRTVEEDSIENSQTEIVIVRQKQITSTKPDTLITNGTTEINTETTTEVTTSTSNSTETYGYGPSNGYDHISITYGPPYYSAPYIDWYASESTKNQIVKKVRDVLGVN